MLHSSFRQKINLNEEMYEWMKKLSSRVAKVPTRVAKFPSLPKMPNWGRKNAKVCSKIADTYSYYYYCYYYYMLDDCPSLKLTK